MISGGITRRIEWNVKHQLGRLCAFLWRMLHRVWQEHSLFFHQIADIVRYFGPEVQPLKRSLIEAQPRQLSDTLYGVVNGGFFGSTRVQSPRQLRSGFPFFSLKISTQ
jgi:hypothetical protein